MEVELACEGRERVIVSPISSSESDMRSLESGLGFDADIVAVERDGFCFGLVVVGFCVVP